MQDQITRELLLKRAGQITLGAVATGAITVAPALLEVDCSDADARSSKRGRRILREARRWIGTDYDLGGNGRRGIDCSALIKKVYGRAIGVYVPDDPETIWREGRERRGKPAIGDICCYKEHGANYITHVGIQSHGRQIVHASGYWDEVVEADKFWNRCGYVGAVVWR